MARAQNPAVRDFILRIADEHPNTVASLTAEKFGLSRTGVARYMSRLVAEGLLVAEGNTKARRYHLKPLVNFVRTLDRTGLWNEDTIWRERILPLFTDVKQNVIDICHYGFTEMLNNVLDHSQSPDAIVSYRQTYAQISMYVTDHGVGIFNKVKDDFHLADARTALLELSKGKLTSDRKRHSGEGIYFTSRMFDKFSILSGDLFYSRIRADDDDWLIETRNQADAVKGTFVTMTIRTDTDRTTLDVFDKYQGENVYFRKTHVPVVLSRYPGEQLVSRSQAKRLLARFTDFSEVMLDFTGVNEIGQPFADEIFRVFRNEHPDTAVVAFNTNKNIDRMIRYVQSNPTTEGTLPLPFDEPKT